MLVYGECECFVMQMFVSCVHPVAVLNAAFCMTCSLLMLVEDAIGDHILVIYLFKALSLTNLPSTETKWYYVLQLILLFLRSL